MVDTGEGLTNSPYCEIPQYASNAREFFLVEKTIPSTAINTGKRKRIARQIALTSESIGKKHRALKTGQIEDKVTLEKRLKPLIEPLKQIAGNTQSSSVNSTSIGNTFVKKIN